MGKFLCTSASHSDHQGVFGKIGLLTAEMFNFILILFPQVVKPQTVPLRIHDFAELMLQAAALCRIQQTFKHRILHPLAIIHALLCDLPQSFSTSGILRVYIIGDQYQHKRLTSIKRAGNPPDLREGNGPTADFGYTEPVPTEFFHPGTDG